MPKIEEFAWVPVSFTEEEAAALSITLKGETPGKAISPPLMGMAVDSIFLGIMLCLFLTWINHSRRTELRAIKIAVYWACFMGVVGSVLSYVWILHIFAFNYGSFVPWINNRWVSFFPLIDSCMTITVQVFYAERAYKIAGRSKLVIVSVLFPLVVSFAGAIGVAVSSMLKQAIDQRYNNFCWMWVCGTFVADVVVTGVVLVGLFKQRSEWEQTDNLVKRLILISCESQLPPTLLAFALMTDFAIQGDSYYAVFFEMVQGKLYVVGMIYVLNSRYALRRNMDSGHVESYKPNTYNMTRSRGNGNGNNNNKNNGNNGGVATIHVQTETYIESHQIDAAFQEHKIQPKLRAPSESGETDFGSSHAGSQHHGDVNLSEVGLNSPYMEHQSKNKDYYGSYAA